MAMKKYANVKEYFADMTAENKEELFRIKAMILDIVPEAEEDLRYGIPTYRYKNRNMIHIAAFEDHLSVFPGSMPIKLLADKLTDFKIAKGTIQFTLDHKIPDPLLKEIIALCKEQVEATLRR